MKVQPFDRYGSPSEIATRHFGGVRGMKDAVSRLQTAFTNNSKNEILIPCPPKPAPPHPAKEVPRTAQGQSAADHPREPVGADRHRAQDPAQGQGPQWRRGPLPLLTWVMFLKFLDDLEAVHEEEAELDGKRYQPIIEAPYRWRDWAAREDGITGDELLAFINQEQTRRADGSAARACSPTCAAWPAGREGQPARSHRQRVQGRAEPHGQRLPAARHHQQDQRHPLQRSEEIHTSRTCTNRCCARCATRRATRASSTRRARGALHGAGDRPAPGRDRARPGLRHRRLPGGGLRPHRPAGEERPTSAAPCSATPSSARKPSRCPTCWRR
jgi:hypothetical protein